MASPSSPNRVPVLSAPTILSFVGHGLGGLAFKPNFYDPGRNGWPTLLGAMNVEGSLCVAFTCPGFSCVPAPPCSTVTQGIDKLVNQGLPDGNQTRGNCTEAVADFTGDGYEDVIQIPYWNAAPNPPPDPPAQTYFFRGNDHGSFDEDTNFTAGLGSQIRGRGETGVVADFNNDGFLDTYLPFYTFPGDVFVNSPQNYLLLGDGQGGFVDVADAAGVAVRMGDCDADDPTCGPRPEGLQALDIDGDGWIDLYVSGRLFINKGIDPSTGIVRFAAPILVPGAENFDAGESDTGITFLDWDNDGVLDLAVLDPGNRTAGSSTVSAQVRLFRFAMDSDPRCPGSGYRFCEVTTFSDDLSVPIFYSGDPTEPHVSVCGVPGGGSCFCGATPNSACRISINAYDLDNDGLVDLVAGGADLAGQVLASVVLRNTGQGFIATDAGDLSTFGGSNGLAFADINRDGKIDAADNADTPSYFINETQLPPENRSFTIEVLGPNGEQNQFGRLVRVSPPGQRPFARVVDSGSGYKSKNQYPLLIGSRFNGVHQLAVTYSPVPGTPGPPRIVSFGARPGQYVKVFAPSLAFPSGNVVVVDPYAVATLTTQTCSTISD